MGLAEKRKGLHTSKGSLRQMAMVVTLVSLLVGSQLLGSTFGKVRRGFSLRESTPQIGSSNPNVGQLAPDFTLTDLEGDAWVIWSIRHCSWLCRQVFSLHSLRAAYPSTRHFSLT
ncbi:MAG: hypothetical protein QME87_01990 [Bacillota bacterium]|nr:hypothetical protein [Bacillota bacterium]